MRAPDARAPGEDTRGAAAGIGALCPGPHDDRIARWRSVVVDRVERRYREVGLRTLAAREGERVLEVGYGGGPAIVEIARTVGPTGFVGGVDASPQMRRIAMRRMRDAGLDAELDIVVGDARRLPYPDAWFDAVFSSFTFGAHGPAMASEALLESRRVLRPGGRLVVVALSDRDDASVPARILRRVRVLLPDSVDLVPIPLGPMVRAADLIVAKELHLTLAGLAVDVVRAFRRVRRTP
jgi:ubiquinone/menaquinone biosynthesis C-methylase UbiE